MMRDQRAVRIASKVKSLGYGNTNGARLLDKRIVHFGDNTTMRYLSAMPQKTGDGYTLALFATIGYITGAEEARVDFFTGEILHKDVPKGIKPTSFQQDIKAWKAKSVDPYAAAAVAAASNWSMWNRSEEETRVAELFLTCVTMTEREREVALSLIKAGTDLEPEELENTVHGILTWNGTGMANAGAL